MKVGKRAIDDRPYMRAGGAEVEGAVFVLLRSDPSSVSCDDTFPRGEGFGAGRIRRGVVRVWEIVLHTSSVKNQRFLTASPQGEAKGRCRAGARVWWCVHEGGKAGDR